MMNATHVSLAYGPVIALPAPEEGCTPKQARMRRAFALVSPEAWGRADWKEQVSAVLTDADLEVSGVTLAEVVEAVEFMTATPAAVSDHPTTSGATVHVVRAPGYRRGPAG